MPTRFFSPRPRRQPFSILVLTILGWLLVGWIGREASTPSPATDDDISLFMRAKLVSSQKVMEGLVTEQFSLIEKGSAEMLKMSEATHWPQSSDEVYKHYNDLFRRQCRKLMKQADGNDLQASHYTYLHMTTTCIDCHNYVRGRFRVEKDDSNRRGPIQLIPTEWEGPAKSDRNAMQPSSHRGVRKQRNN